MRVEQLGSPTLRQRSQPVSNADFDEGLVDQTLNRMKQVLDGIKSISPINGDAIAAPQVAVLKRLILLRLEGDFVAIINPAIQEASEELFEFTEECFSFYHLRANLARHRKITVSFVNEQGQNEVRQFADEMAAIIQHELDHLDGILFTDRLSSHSKLRTADYEFRNDPNRLENIRKIVAYVTSPLPS